MNDAEPSRPTFVLGTGGLAREMAQLFEVVRARPIDGFIGADSQEIGRDLGFARVVGDDQWLLEGGLAADIVVGIGYPDIRARVLRGYLAEGRPFGFPNLIHPDAVLDPRRVSLGRGNTVTAGCIFTIDVSVGDFNLFNWNVTVGHDVEVGSFCVINPAASVSGGVRVHDGVLVGTGARILERLEIGDQAIVGAGAVVTRDVSARTTVLGIPARPVG